MTPERHQQIGEIYHAVLEVDPEERAAFLDRACAGDEALRREVESLIASHEQASNFIATPALALAAGLLAKRDSLVGEMLSHFRILSLVGEGGMGEVYLAEDTRLRRPVALKLLSAAFTNDAGRMRRFMQEARAASALNHPNILTVHEIGEASGVHFIATEFIEGETLRPSIAERLKLPQALDIAAQVAGALAAAHTAGVIHRDIKPENIMVRPDGFVKVLDFGLAKLIERKLPPDGATINTKVETNPGMVMGTVQYMSPEQARGLPVDARTDVWSLGVVLYEMVASRPPFSGDTPSDTIVSILEREPPPLTLNAPEVSAELERIVTKALTKEKDERYQTVKDMAIDLRRLRRRLDVQAEIERFAQSGGQAPSTDADTTGIPTKPQQTDPVPTGIQSVRASYVDSGRQTSSIELVVDEMRRHRRGAAVVVAGLALLIAGFSYGVYKLLNRSERNPLAPFQAMNISRLTNDGNAVLAAISPDGRNAAYVLRTDKGQSLRVRQVATSSDLQILPAAEVVFIGLTFSPNGDYLYYVTLKARDTLGILESEDTGTLYQVPTLGGASRKLVTGVDSAVTFSPDGRRLAFVRAFADGGESALMIANTDGSAEQKLAGRPPPEVYLSKGRIGSGPAWSPDGRSIVCGIGRFARQQVVVVSTVDGSEKPLGTEHWQFIGRLSWFGDGSGLVMAAMDTKLMSQVWQLSYPAGEVRRITNDLNTYSWVSLDANANSLLTVQADTRTLHLSVLDTEGETRKILSTRSGNAEGPSWTPDGKLVYTAIGDSGGNLWMANKDGSEQKQLTAFTNPLVSRASVSPSGQHIVFVSDRAGPRNIWRVDIDGSNPVRLTTGELDTWPTCSKDGRWVVYASGQTGKSSLWKVPIDGGEPTRLTTNNFAPTPPSVSPDGKLVVYSSKSEQPGSSLKIMVVSFDDGVPIKTFDLPPTAEPKVVWMPDGQSLAYINSLNDISNIWSQPLDGGSPKQLTNFNSERIASFDWSRDGKQLALSRGTVTRNVVIISHFH